MTSDKNEPICSGPHTSAFDCPVHDPRKREAPPPPKPHKGETPRTDAEEMKLKSRGNWHGEIAVVGSDFARQLERELTEEQARHEACRLLALGWKEDAERRSAIAAPVEEAVREAKRIIDWPELVPSKRINILLATEIVRLSVPTERGPK